MQIYGPSQVHGAQQIGPPHTSSRVAGSSATSAAAPIQDEVNISDAARSADASGQTTGIRQDRVDAIRAQIASGTYETPEKLDIAMQRLLDQIG
jgi:negative regulator of flagellin synthesis FlgM